MEKGAIFGRNGVLPQKRQKPTPKPQPTERKTRSDKKHDIKVLLTPDEKRRLKLAAFDTGVPVTALASDVVKRALSEDVVFREHEYPETGTFVHVVLEEAYFKQIRELSVQWDLSFRRVAHVILKRYLNRRVEYIDGVEIIGG